MNTLLYFDAGLGALIAQGAIAALAGIVLFYKTVLYTVKSWLGMQSAPKDDFDDLYDGATKDEEE